MPKIDFKFNLSSGIRFPKFTNFNEKYVLDAHTSSLMMSDSDSEDDEEIIFTDDLPTDSRTLVSNGNLSKRNGINRTNTKPDIRA